MNNSIKLKQQTDSDPYLSLLDWPFNRDYLSLLITIMSFKTGNVVAFKLDSNVDFSFANFQGLFSETLYGAVPQHFDYRLDYHGCPNKYHRTCWLCRNRYNFLARKQSLVFLIIQMVPTLGL